MIPKVNVAVNLCCFALLTWLYGGDLYDASRAASAEVSALTAPPSVPFAGLLVALAFAGGGLTLLGVTKKRDRTWKGYRVMPIVTVVGLFVDVLVISSEKTPFSSSMRAAAAIEQFEHRAAELSSATSVSSDAAALQQLADELGPPPWLHRAQPIPKWTVEVEFACAGPRGDARGAAPGTLFYCVTPDRAKAWLTAVGLPREERFGSAQVVSSGGQPLVGVVQIRAPEEVAEPPVPPPGSEGSGPEEVVAPPMYFETDAGNL